MLCNNALRLAGDGEISMFCIKVTVQKCFWRITSIYIYIDLYNACEMFPRQVEKDGVSKPKTRQ